MRRRQKKRKNMKKKKNSRQNPPAPTLENPLCRKKADIYRKRPTSSRDDSGYIYIYMCVCVCVCV